MKNLFDLLEGRRCFQGPFRLEARHKVEKLADWGEADRSFNVHRGRGVREE